MKDITNKDIKIGDAVIYATGNGTLGIYVFYESEYLGLSNMGTEVWGYPTLLRLNYNGRVVKQPVQNRRFYVIPESEIENLHEIDREFIALARLYINNPKLYKTKTKLLSAKNNLKNYEKNS